MIKIAFPILSLCLALIGCTPNAVTPVSTITTNQSMSATVDGANWSASTVVGVSSSGTFAIEGTKTDGSFLEVILPATSAGPYRIDGSGSSQIIWDKDPSTSFHAVSGIIHVKTFVGNVITGDFDSVVCIGTGVNMTNITKGSFSTTMK